MLLQRVFRETKVFGLSFDRQIEIFLCPTDFPRLLRLCPGKGIATSGGYMHYGYLDQRINKLMHEPIPRYNHHPPELLRIRDILEEFLTVPPAFRPYHLPPKMRLTQKLQTNLEV